MRLATLLHNTPGCDVNTPVFAIPIRSGAFRLDIWNLIYSSYHKKIWKSTFFFSLQEYMDLNLPGQ